MRWPRAHAMNDMILAVTGAWAIDEDSVRLAYALANKGKDASQAKVEELHKRVNRSDTLYTMAILASRALVDRSSRETYSLRGLASVIDEKDDKSVQNTLRNVILPTLAELGWIEPFAKQEPGRRQTHEIVMAEAGIDLHAQFLRRCFEETRDLLEELLDGSDDEREGLGGEDRAP